MASENYAEMIKEAKSVVAEMESKTFEASNVTVNAVGITSQLQDLDKTKMDLKKEFHKTLITNSFMRNLGAPKEEWNAITTQSDEELQTAKNILKEAKQTTEDQKTQMTQLNAVVEQGLTLYHQNLQTLKEKLESLESMSQELVALQETLPGSGAGLDEALGKELQMEIAKHAAKVKECRKELGQIEHSYAQMQLFTAQIEDDLQQLTLTLDEDQECMDTRCLSRLLKCINNMESISGVTCKSLDAHTVVVEFPPRQPGQPPASKGGMPGDELVLKVTLTFKENSVGYLHLSSVKCNMDSLAVEDLWKESADRTVGRLPCLISSIKLRWFSHVPLLSEINHLRCRFAIDWIQQESTLRVIVGKGGGIVCSLQIPPGYPQQGQVTLTDVMGATEDIAVAELKPQTGNKLEDWVLFLENLFGKP